MRRVMLLVLGICGGMAAAVLLCVSATAQHSFAKAASCLHFPFAIEGTPLVVLDRVCYDGPFIEDGGDGEVAGVAAVLIRNTGQAMVESAAITMMQQCDTQHYCLTMLPPGATALVLERDQKEYNTDFYIGSDGGAVLHVYRPCGVVAQITEDNRLAVSNTSSRVITALTVYYRACDPQTLMYMGGITYQADIKDLQPGEMRIINADHVAYGYTKIIAVK